MCTIYIHGNCHLVLQPLSVVGHSGDGCLDGLDEFCLYYIYCQYSALFPRPVLYNGTPACATRSHGSASSSVLSKRKGTIVGHLLTATDGGHGQSVRPLPPPPPWPRRSQQYSPYGRLATFCKGRPLSTVGVSNFTRCLGAASTTSGATTETWNASGTHPLPLRHTSDDEFVEPYVRETSASISPTGLEGPFHPCSFEHDTGIIPCDWYLKSIPVNVTHATMAAYSRRRNDSTLRGTQHLCSGQPPMSGGVLRSSVRTRTRSGDHSIDEVSATFKKASLRDRTYQVGVNAPV